LTGDQAEEWRAVVGRMPPDWFPRETHPLLAQYCRHVVIARRLAEKVNGFDRACLGNLDGLRQYDALLRMSERQTKALATLATKMRLTQQARYRPETAARAADKSTGGKRPWET